MSASSFKLSPEAVSDVQTLQGHLKTAMGVKLSRTKAIERTLRWLALQISTGGISHAELAEMPNPSALSGCTLCHGSGWVPSLMPEGTKPGKDVCPRCCE